MAKEYIEGSQYIVHEELEKYISFGPTKGDKNESPETKINAYLAIHQEHHKKLKEKANGLFRIQEIEGAYNQFFKQEGRDEGISEKRIKEVGKKFVESSNKILNEKFNEAAGKISIDKILQPEGGMDTSKLEGIRSKVAATFTKAIDKIDTENKTQQNKVITFLDRIDKLLKIVDAALKDKNTSKMKESLLAIADKTNKSMKGIYRELQALAEKYKGIDSYFISTEKGTEGRADLDVINNYISLLGQMPKFGSSANQRGVMGELAGALLPYLLLEERDILLNELDKVIDESIKGGDTLGVTYKDLFNTNKSNQNGMTKTIIKEGKTVKVEVAPKHVSKTDVEFDLKISEKMKGKIKEINDPLKLSIKSYKNIASKLTLVDGTPLSTLLYSIDTSEMFLGHYANLITEREGEIDPRFFKWRSIMNNIITNQAVVNAFQGYDSLNVPNVFLVFDNTRNKVRAYNMETLIAKVLLKKNTSEIETQDHQSLSELRLIAGGKTSEQLTIAAIAKLHETKLHVSVSLKNVDNLTN